MSQIFPQENCHVTTTAPSQLAGYTVQYFRALLRLLQCKPGEAVSIEHVCDVGVKQRNGNLILEEDKSSIASNPLGDLSPNLWKTFRNWILYLKESKTDVARCHFVLYVVAPSGKRSLLEAFSKATIPSAANRAIVKAKDVVSKSASQDIMDYARIVLEENRTMFRDVICRLDVQSVDSEVMIDEEIRDVFRSWLISENRLDESKNHCLGWLISRIIGEIRQQRTPIIEYDDFRRQNSAFFKEVRSGVLMDFSQDQMPDETMLADEGRSDKVYVRQLQAIDISGKKMLQACSDYYKAEINRQMWIDQEMVSHEAAKDFEGRLCSAYENERDLLELSPTGANDIQKGQLLLNACERRQERLAGMDVVDRFIPGTYHHLADECKLGWHPQWRALFLGQEEEES